MNLFPTLFFLALTLALYSLAQWIYERLRWPIFHPILLCVTALIAILKLGNFSYSEYMQGGRYLHFLLGPAIVALAIPLHETWSTLAKNPRAILLALGAGSLSGIFSVLWLGAWMKLPTPLLYSLAPKSVTTPIAIAISDQIGGIPSLSAAIVLVTGILIALLGPLLQKIFLREQPLAYGFAMGMSGHIIATARAQEAGALAAAASALALCCHGITLSLLAPGILWIWESL